MYFDENNNYFEEENNYKDNIVNFNIDNMIINRSNTLHDYEDGYNKGNMFKDIYSKYKNHVYKLKVNNYKDELLYKLQMYTFILKDLNLYLDTNPTDTSIMNEYLKVNASLKSIKNEYEKKYGPLCINDITSDKWTWINNPWPWDKGGK